MFKKKLVQNKQAKKEERERERVKQIRNRLNSREEIDDYQRELARGRVKQVMGIMQCTCDEHQDCVELLNH